MQEWEYLLFWVGLHSPKGWVLLVLGFVLDEQLATAAKDAAQQFWLMSQLQPLLGTQVLAIVMHILETSRLNISVLLFFQTEPAKW